MGEENTHENNCYLTLQDKYNIHTTVYGLTRQGMFGLVHIWFGAEPYCGRAGGGWEFCLFVCFLHGLGGGECFVGHFLLSDGTFWLCHRVLIEK